MKLQKFWIINAQQNRLQIEKNQLPKTLSAFYLKDPSDKKSKRFTPEMTMKISGKILHNFVNFIMDTQINTHLSRHNKCKHKVVNKLEFNFISGGNSLFEILLAPQNGWAK